MVEFVQAGGLEIAYERAGEGPPLLLAHGAGDDSRIWQPQLAGLADEFTVVAWDEPGAGRSSDLPEGFGLTDFADALAALIEALDLGPAHVAGLSWGGTVVLELYRVHPELVGTLIMIDTYAGWRGSLPSAEVEARVAAARQMLAAPPGQFDPTFPGLFALEPPAQFAPLLAAVAADVRPATLGRQLAIMAEADLSDLLPHVSVPTLLIWGQLDARSPLHVAHQFEEAIADSELVVIEGAGHLSNLERPERVNDAVREFCRAFETLAAVTAAHGSRRPDVTTVELFGGIEKRALVLADHDPQWREAYAEHERRIRGALGPAAVRVAHIGSTSVPGLAAKPIIDVLVTVEDITAEEDYLDRLLAAGYELRVREPGHRLVRTPDRDVHVHVLEAGDEDAEDYLLLRDRLRADPEDRVLYERTKRALLEQDWPDMNAYAQAKTEVIDEIKERARGMRP